MSRACVTSAQATRLCHTQVCVISRALTRLRLRHETLSGTLGALASGQADLALGALADNGGPTPTIALGGGSLAIDAGVSASCADSPVSGIDQRGYARSVGVCDSGAFEYGAGPAAVKPPPSWLLATTRPSSADICPTGSNPSWAYWPNEGTGGFTCESSIVFDPRTDTWVSQPGLANG